MPVETGIGDVQGTSCSVSGEYSTTQETIAEYRRDCSPRCHWLSTRCRRHLFLFQQPLTLLLCGCLAGVPEGDRIRGKEKAETLPSTLLHRCYLCYCCVLQLLYCCVLCEIGAKQVTVIAEAYCLGDRAKRLHFTTVSNQHPPIDLHQQPTSNGSGHATRTSIHHAMIVRSAVAAQRSPSKQITVV